MGKRYYCDYCDRSFKDAQGARKKHLISLQHTKNREEHYNLYKDPEQILKDEAMKKPCTRFINQGECPFGTSCRYSHYTPEMIQQLENYVTSRNEIKAKMYNPDPEKILSEYFENTIDPEEIVDNNIDLWPLPDELKIFQNLPLSIQPMTYKNFTSSDFPDWGWH